MHKIRKTYASKLYHNGVNVSVVKDVLGHADEATTLRHYIFNVESQKETDQLVRSVLEEKPENSLKGTAGDLKIIYFPEIKKPGNPENTRLPAHN